MNTRRLLVSFVLVTVSAMAAGACTSHVTDGNEGSSGGTSGGTSGSPSSGIGGSYAGTYKGADSGAVSMTITGTKIDVVATVGGKKYPGSGEITNSGGVSVGIGAGEGVTVTFSGTFSGASGSGTWSSSIGTSGTWSVAK